jgi:hypothetical protein
MVRFRLSTLLICIFVAAVVLTYCANVEVLDVSVFTHGDGECFWPFREPNQTEIIQRLAWAEPLALITTLVAIQGIRRIWRSIPHNSKVDE